MPRSTITPDERTEVVETLSALITPLILGVVRQVLISVLAVTNHFVYTAARLGETFRIVNLRSAGRLCQDNENQGLR